MTVSSLSDIKDADVKGKTFLVRIDTNVSLEEGSVKSDFRLRAVLPTFEFLLERGARVVAVGHMEPSPEASIEAVAEYYKKLFPTSFIKSCEPEHVRGHVDVLKNGEVLFLENLRSLPYEKENDEHFARALASLADVYVNEAFSVSHRAHASVVGIPRHLPSFAGFCFEKEIRELSFSFSPERPFVFILGGLKFKTKAPLIEKFILRSDVVFVGGALANSFFKEKGWEIGVSAFDEGVDLSGLIEKKNLFLPVDVVVENEGGASVVVEASGVSGSDNIVDIGPETMKILMEKISSAQLVVWNGPMGNIEKGFTRYTHAVAEEVSRSKCYSIVGGGDTIAAVGDPGPDDRFSFISTGGGAMLDFLVNETLPGIDALRKSQKDRS